MGVYFHLYMRKIIYIITCFFLYLFFARETYAQIVINEIGAFEKQDSEWIEVLNAGTQSVDLGGWKFYEEGKPSFVSKVIWMVFFTLILVRWWSADSQEIGNFGKFVYPIVLILVLMMFLFEKKFYFHLIKNKIKEGIGVLNSSSDRRMLGKIAEKYAEADALEDGGRPDEAEAIRSTIRKMESSLKKS